MPATFFLPSFYSSIAVFLLGAIALVVSSGYSVGAALLLLGGLYVLCSRHKPALTKQDWLVLAALVLYGLMGIIEGLFYQYPSRAYDLPSRFLAAAIALFFVLKYPPRLTWVWAGLATGGVLAGCWAGYQKIFLHIDRAKGFTHVIQFGNISMLTGLFCLAGLAWACTRPNKRGWILWLSLGALGGIAGSLFSGSRGGWIGLPLIALIFFRVYHQYFSLRLKLLFSTAIVGLAVVIYSVPQFGVQQRIHEAINNISLYTQGQSNTSLGARFEMWNGASQLFMAKPIFGWGKAQYKSAMTELADQGKAHPVVKMFDHPHNEILNNAAKQGIVGILALLFLYVVPLRLFASGLRAASLTQRSLATAGFLLPIAYIDFGLSQAFLTHNSGVMVYAFWLIVLWGSYRFYSTQK
ncbi:O-antigen ligase family protein [Paenalcaligenes sp. Me131]|uniref:O-antigen ligase family protein n=1 Tax=Paenalcaligenes sp. Me131 TaxID=3392636 RepID=UPI003D2DF07A